MKIGSIASWDGIGWAWGQLNDGLKNVKIKSSSWRPLEWNDTKKELSLKMSCKTEWCDQWIQQG